MTQHKLFVIDNQFYIRDRDGIGDRPRSGPSNGLVDPLDSGAMIITGVEVGYVLVEAEVLALAPASVALDGWDDVAEVSVQCPHGDAWVASGQDLPPGLPLLTPAGPGSYRLRVHAAGRDVALDDPVSDEPVEHYLIVIWPAPPSADELIKATDERGRGFRMSSGWPTD